MCKRLYKLELAHSSTNLCICQARKHTRCIYTQGRERMGDHAEVPEFIPLSHLNAYAYCPRRFYYEFTLAEMVVNEHVLQGQQLHERVDRFGSSTRDEKVQLRHMYLCAPTLGLTGYCDLLEAEGAGTDLATL